MASPDDFRAVRDEFAALRRDLHAHPETAFEEVRTGRIVAERLESWGIAVTRGLARTGVVGTLRAGEGTRAIALRADMDALNMQELNDFPHRSTRDGKMHACGHDGHTTMLLAAAQRLAATRRFDGTVHFIFQPAEENEGGGRVMVEEGLFERFPSDAVYGMHNMPGIAVGCIAVQDGPALASSDSWEVVMKGRGTHGAKPHLGADATVAAANFVLALQSVTSRTIDARIRGGEPRLDARRRPRDVERDPRRGRAARHRARLPPARARPARGGDRPRRRRRGAHAWLPR